MPVARTSVPAARPLGRPIFDLLAVQKRIVVHMSLIPMSKRTFAQPATLTLTQGERS
jgi:hypothetical protein